MSEEIKYFSIKNLFTNFADYRCLIRKEKRETVLSSLYENCFLSRCYRFDLCVVNKKIG